MGSHTKGRDLWESHRRKISVAPSHYLGILVAGDAEGSPIIC